MKQNLFSKMIYLSSVLLLLSACSTSSGTIASSLPSYKGPMPTVVIDNTAPSNIDINFGIGLHQTDPTKPATFSLGAAFFYQQKSIIVFKHGEKFVCNGIPLPMDSSSVPGTSNIPAPGTLINCTYTSPQGQASFSIAAPEQPKIISPASGATIVRSTQTPLVVSVIPTCKNLGIIIGTKNSHGYGGESVGSPNGCVTQQTVDASNVPTGPGMLGVDENEMVTDAITNPGFHSFAVSISSDITIPVTWQ